MCVKCAVQFILSLVQSMPIFNNELQLILITTINLKHPIKDERPEDYMKSQIPLGPPKTASGRPAINNIHKIEMYAKGDR